MVRQHEDRVLEGRVVAPPALPVLVGPGAAKGAEHVAAHDRGAHALEGPGRVAVVQPRAAPLAADHGLEGAGGKEPVHDLDGVLAEGFGLALLKTGPETIEGTAEGANHDFRHSGSSMRGAVEGRGRAGFGNWNQLSAISQRTYSKSGRSRLAGRSIRGPSGERDALKTCRPRADNTRVLCQCSAPNTHATRRFAARYRTPPRAAGEAPTTEAG